MEYIDENIDELMSGEQMDFRTDTDTDFLSMRFRIEDGVDMFNNVYRARIESADLWDKELTTS